ncbi:MAG: CDP-alcohol phosphatidyltransferase family protein [Hyphomicrobiales bacterium]
MLDGQMRKLIDPPLNKAGQWLASKNVTANGVTIAGFVMGLLAAVAIAFQFYVLGLVLLLISRLADGLDGAVARVNGTSDLGGFLDITLDFFFYGAIPLAFAISNPDANAFAAAVLLTGFYATGSSFLAFAIMAEKRKITTTAKGIKSLYYIGGLAEGTETIGVFVAFCLFPQWFAIIAYVFAAICFVTAANRVVIGWVSLKNAN